MRKAIWKVLSLTLPFLLLAPHASGQLIRNHNEVNQTYRARCILALGQSQLNNSLENGPEGLVSEQITGVPDYYVYWISPGTLITSPTNSSTVQTGNARTYFDTGWAWSMDLIFGRDLQKITEQDVYVIKYAVGGAAIADFMKEDLNNRGMYEFYSNKVAAARAFYPNMPDVTDIVWVQGESDSASASRSSAYKANLTTYYNDLVTDFCGGTNVNFVVAGLGSRYFPEGVHGEYGVVVTAAQLEYCKENSYADYVYARDLPTISDEVHYNNEGKITIGHRITMALVDSDGDTTITHIGGSEIKLSWLGLEGGTYTVQYTENLALGTWSNLLTDISGVYGTMSNTNSATSAQAFYRVIGEYN